MRRAMDLSLLLLPLCIGAASETNYVDEDTRIAMTVLKAFDPTENFHRNNTRDICSWSKVKCVRVQDRWRVSSLDLWSWSRGPLSEEVCKLTWLQRLECSRIEGPIPACIGQLQMLRELEFTHGEKMTGQIPESIGELRQLEFFKLEDSALTGQVPLSLWSLPKLLYVHIRPSSSGKSTMTVELPEEVGQLSQLEELWLWNMQMTKPLPASFGLLSRVSWVDLESMKLSGPLPSSMGLLRRLGRLRMNDNLLEELPASMASMTRLYELHVMDNQLKDFPLSFTAMKKLGRLQISGNPGSARWTDGDCGPGWGDECNLFPLKKSDTQCLDNETASLLEAVVKSLWGASYDVIAGWKTPCLCFWKGVSCMSTESDVRVSGISFQSKDLAGELPAELGQLTDLEFLDLQGQLTGTIPEELGQLQKLKLLDLSGNRLLGPLPGSILKLKELQLLSLAGNQLSGPIADQPVMPELMVMNISGNKLESFLPSSAKLPKLRYLDFRRNAVKQGVAASVSVDWEAFSSLWELRLAGNAFSFNVPEGFAKLQQLRVLDVSDTELGGRIPPSMERMPRLVEFNIRGTQIPRGKFEEESLGGDGSNCAPMLEDPCDFFEHSDRGRLEKFLRELWTEAFWQRHAYTATQPMCSWSGVTCADVDGRPRVVKLILEDALMSGSLPGASLGSLSELRELRIRSRQTRGVLPFGLRDLTKLEILELQGPFDGSLLECSWLGHMTSLRVLILRTNFHLDRTFDLLPESVRNLKNLEVLDLTGNRVKQMLRYFLEHLQNMKLRELRLSGNLLFGPIDDAIGQLADLEVLELDGNQLISELPSGLARLQKLRKLDLSGNMFEGRVPKDLGKLPHLTHLGLGKNHFKENITVENCAPISQDPCQIFRFRLVPKDRDESWPFIIGASLLLSGIFYRDKTCQGLDVPAGALEIAASSGEGIKLRMIAAVVDVVVLCFCVTLPLLWIPLVSYIMLPILLVGKLTISTLLHKEPILRPLDLLWPKGTSVYQLRSREVSAHAALLTGVAFTTFLATIVDNECILVEAFFFVACVLGFVRVQLAASRTPFDEQYEAKAATLRRVAKVMQVFTSDPRWVRINERTFAVDFEPSSEQLRSFEEIEMQNPTFSSSQSPQHASHAENEATPLDPEQPKSAPDSAPTRPGRERSSSLTMVSVTVGRMFAMGGPISLTMKWTEREWTENQQSQSHKVWLLELGPCVFGGPGGVMLDILLVLVLLALSVAMLWQFTGPGYLSLSVALLAAVWRLTIWNVLAWARLPTEISATLQRGYFTDALMRVKSDAFGVLAPVLALTACWSAFTSSTSTLLLAIVPMLLTAWQLRAQDRSAGFL